jgi:hypothetical protein
MYKEIERLAEILLTNNGIEIVDDTRSYQEIAIGLGILSVRLRTEPITATDEV